jgi:hypothetical protein
MPQADPDILRSAVEFWQKLYSAREAKVKFVKKDGTIRIMRCTLNFEMIPKSKYPKSVNVPQILKLIQNSGIMHVYDLDKKDWRSVPFKTVDWLELDGDQNKRFKIRPYKKD